MTLESSKQQPRRRPKQYLVDRTKGKVKILDGDDNENTDTKLADKSPFSCCYVPPPIYYCAQLVEQTVICETYGGIGCCGARRRRLMMCGFVANTISLILSILACLAISLQFDILRRFPFSMGSVTVPAGESGGPSLPLLEEGFDVTRMWIGLRGVALSTYADGSQIMGGVPGNYVIGFDEFYGFIGNGLENYMDPADCEACADVGSIL
ncbi:MAG: hypothetical protein SGARI_005653, partial [Bacillariaceae sp.]